MNVLIDIAEHLMEFFKVCLATRFVNRQANCGCCPLPRNGEVFLENKFHIFCTHHPVNFASLWYFNQRLLVDRVDEVDARQRGVGGVFRERLVGGAREGSRASV